MAFALLFVVGITVAMCKGGTLCCRKLMTDDGEDSPSTTRIPLHDNGGDLQPELLRIMLPWKPVRGSSSKTRFVVSCLTRDS